MRSPRFPLAFLLLPIFAVSFARGQGGGLDSDGSMTQTSPPAKIHEQNHPSGDPLKNVVPMGTNGVVKEPAGIDLIKNEGKDTYNALPVKESMRGQTGSPKGFGNLGRVGMVGAGANGITGGALFTIPTKAPSTPEGPSAPETPREAAASNAVYEKTLARDPDNIPALVGHMQEAAVLGDRAASVSAARHVLELDPKNEAAQRAIADGARLDKASGAAKKFDKLAQMMKTGPAEDDAQARNAAQLAGLAGPAGRVAPLTGAGGASPLAAGGSAAAAGTAQAGGRTVAGGGVPGAAAPGAYVLGAGAVGVSVPGAPARAFSPLVVRAVQKIGMGDDTGALFDITQAVDSNPEDGGAWTVRSEVETRLKNYRAAAADASKAIALAPENARAYRARAFAELGSMQYSEALVDAVHSIELDPKNGLGYFYKALAEEGLGRISEAASDVKQALSLDSSLEPMAHPLMSKLGLAPAGVSGSKKWLVRGGLIAGASVLVLFGLLGTKKGKTLRGALTPRRMGAEIGTPALAELALGSLVAGNYRVIKELGRGGMGVVYEGLDEALQRRVAIKRLLQDGGTTREDLDRFLREARLVASLKHPNLAQIYNVVGDGQPLLVFEYVDGQPLDKVLSSERALPAGRVRRIVEETASALQCAHGRDIIHRDLKPSNVMLGSDGSVKVMDFGIAHQARAATQLTRTSASGTPPYMSPEQGMGSVSKASDLYALAVMAYELLSGVRPFEGPDFLEQKLRMRYYPITQRNAAFPKALDEFFARAFEPDPTKRFVDAGVFAGEFGQALEATPKRERAAA